MTEQEYRRFVAEMASVAGISGTFARRRGLEQKYYDHHRLNGGKKLRGKYRP